MNNVQMDNVQMCVPIKTKWLVQMYQQNEKFSDCANYQVNAAKSKSKMHRWKKANHYQKNFLGILNCRKTHHTKWTFASNCYHCFYPWLQHYLCYQAMFYATYHLIRIFRSHFGILNFLFRYLKRMKCASKVKTYLISY